MPSSPARLWQDERMSPSPRHPTHPVGTDRSTVASGIAWVDGRVVPAGEATMPLVDDGVLRGDAVFEAILVRNGRTHDLAPHLARLERSAASLELTLPDVRDVVVDLLLAWGDRGGALKILVTRQGTVRGLLTPVSWPSSLALAVIETPWRTPISGVKTLSYAANQWAIREAVKLDADDALILDQGRLLELPTGSVCLVHDGRVSSPDPARLPILDSVTVRSLCEVVEVERTVPALDDLRAADEVFVVSATRPVLSVHAVVADGEELELPAPGPVTAEVGAAFDAHIDATLDPLP
jgi:branched-subunit amino acid aminotransferase/4-amino-4-deoxychorismate lyase